MNEPIASSVVEGDIEGEAIRDEDGNVIGFRVTSETPDYGYGLMTGTSMAAPHVAGVAALMFAAKSTLTVDQVESMLKSTARAFPATCSGCPAG